MPLCPRCKVNERKQAPGRIRSYCKECEKELANIGSKKFREDNPNYHKEYRREYLKNPEHLAKANARTYTREAIKQGVLEKQTACTECGSINDLQNHHHDYEKPLEVITLCRACHIVLHFNK